jgi:protein-S-isoprenylcysteine O-methyltransferase Ste14
MVVLSLLSVSMSPPVWAYLALVVMFFLISIAYRGIRKDASKIGGTRTDNALFMLVNLAFIVLPFTYAFSSVYDGLDYSLPDPLSIAGVIGLLTALLIRARAHLDLGKSFTIAPGTTRKRDLVTNGIYAHIRHPMYLSMLIWAISAPLVLQNYFIGLMPLISIGAFLLVRLPTEERILLAEFGDRYREYMTHTGRLLPRIF